VFTLKRDLEFLLLILLEELISSSWDPVTGEALAENMEVILLIDRHITVIRL